MDGSQGFISNPKMIISSSSDHDQEHHSDLRRGPWTVEEDFTLINYIHNHGEGHWNSLARLAGLNRTGKSCRLRWLNYLRPDVRRGNITLEEQLLILELHCRWGNRWSKIAQYLPGRTDNEIKNYWRTRVQKHAKQLKCDVNSQQFKDTVRYLWMPRLVERIQAAAAAASASAAATTTDSGVSPATVAATSASYNNYHQSCNNNLAISQVAPNYASENSSTAASSELSFGAQVSPLSDMADHYNMENPNLDYCNYYQGHDQIGYGGDSSSSYNFKYGSDFPGMDQNTNLSCLETSDSLWNVDDIWLFDNL